MVPFICWGLLQDDDVIQHTYQGSRAANILTIACDKDGVFISALWLLVIFYEFLNTIQILSYIPAYHSAKLSLLRVSLSLQRKNIFKMPPVHREIQDESTLLEGSNIGPRKW